MLRLRLTTDRQARAKKKPPAHSTTGVVSTNSIHFPICLGIIESTYKPGTACPIEDQHRDREHKRAPEFSRQRTNFRLVLFNHARRLRLQNHPAFRAFPRMILLDLRMHWAGVGHEFLFNEQFRSRPATTLFAGLFSRCTWITSRGMNLPRRAGKSQSQSHWNSMLILPRLHTVGPRYFLEELISMNKRTHPDAKVARSMHVFARRDCQRKCSSIHGVVGAVAVFALWTTGFATAGQQPQKSANRTDLSRGEFSASLQVPRSDLAKAEALASQLATLSSRVDRNEAKLLADCAYATISQLRRQYRMFGTPIFNNFLIYHGLKKRGYCYQWSEDLLVALDALKLTSLELRWGESNPGN